MGTTGSTIIIMIIIISVVLSEPDGAVELNHFEEKTCFPVHNNNGLNMARISLFTWKMCACQLAIRLDECHIFFCTVRANPLRQRSTLRKSWELTISFGKRKNTRLIYLGT